MSLSSGKRSAAGGAGCARAAEGTVKTWHSWETGKRVPRPASLVKVAETFGLAPSELEPPDRLALLERRVDELEARLAQVSRQFGA